MEPFRQDLSGVHGIVDQLDRFHDLGHKFELSRLDLRHVEQFARNIQQTVAAVLDTAHKLFLLVVELPQPGVAQQLQTHQDRGDRGFHLVRNGRNEIGLGRIQFLVFRHIVQHDQVADELLRRTAYGRNVKRRIFHLEIALLVVGIDFQRLLVIFFLLFAVKSSDKTPQQVVRKRDFRRIASDDILFEIQHGESLVIHEQDIAGRIQTDDRFMQRIHDRFDASLRSHQLVERTAPVFVQLGGHVVERLRHLPDVAEIEPLIVIVVGDLRDPLLQPVDGPQYDCRETNQKDHGQ